MATHQTHTPSPTEGIDRCACGSKYWDGSLCASCGEKFIEENGAEIISAVLPLDRHRLHGRMQKARLTSGSVAEMRALQAATYWESFPESYSSRQVLAAAAMHIASREGFETATYRAAVKNVLALVPGVI
jgi:hypothetical protein